jgi:RNA polymerase sigma-70 factor (family 1)
MSIAEDQFHNAQIQQFKEQFLKHYVSLCMFALRYVNNPEVCQDIVQDSFLVLWEKRENIDLNSSIKPLLYKTVHNKAIDYLRGLSPTITNAEEVSLLPDLEELWDNTFMESTDEEIDCQSIQNEIDEVVMHLPEQCARVYRMSREQGMSNAEIAKSLQISVKAVEKQITKALSTIRIHLINTGYMAYVIWIMLFFYH